MPADTGQIRENKYSMQPQPTWRAKNKEKEDVVIHNIMSRESLQGIVEGKRRRGRPVKIWLDNKCTKPSTFLLCSVSSLHSNCVGLQPPFLHTKNICCLELTMV